MFGHFFLHRPGCFNLGNKNHILLLEDSIASYVNISAVFKVTFGSSPVIDGIFLKFCSFR